MNDDVVALAARAVQAASITGSEDLVAPLISEWMHAAGLTVETVHIDPGAIEVGTEQDLDRRPNLYGWTTRRPGRPVIVLNGHMDVVAPGDGWAGDPFSGEIAGGRLRGRGAADMKGGLAAGLVAAAAVRKADLYCDVVVECVIAEETGGLGTRYALLTGPKPAAAIVLEPTEGKVVSAAGGMVPFVIEATGRSAHSSVPWAGVDAFERADAVRRALADLTARRASQCAHPLFSSLPAPVPMTVGIVRAGNSWAAVPDNARIEGRLGLLPGERLEDFCREVSQLAADAEIDFPFAGFPAWETDAAAPPVAALLAATGQAQPSAVTYGSDAAHFADAGVPVALFGPGSITNAHGSDEYVEVEDLHTAVRVLVDALVECDRRLRP